MNLLVTNSQDIQSYVILRSLRAQANRVVITTGGDSIVSTGIPGMAVYSRFVDAKYTVPTFSSDWLAGRVEPCNTAAEEAYIQRIEEICQLEAIDVIFPSLDPEVYLFSKNKKRFAERGILTVVPEPEVIRVPLDKARTVRAAQSAGFPCPKTYFPASAADLDLVRLQSAPPWMIKPRFTAHGAHMEFVRSADDLEAAFNRVARFQPGVFVQEFIGGAQSRNYYVTVNHASEILSLFAPEVRTTSEDFRTRARSAISGSSGPYLNELRTMIRDLGLWGGYTIQTLIDPTDGEPKLMEINARLGHHVWWRTALGVNEPLILLQLARGEMPTGNLQFPAGVMLLDPYQDFFLLYHRILKAAFRIARSLRNLVRRNGVRNDEREPPVRIFALLRTYARDYFSLRRKRFCPEIANLLVDPYACLRLFASNFALMTRSWFGGPVGRLVGVFRRQPRETNQL